MTFLYKQCYQYAISMVLTMQTIIVEGDAMIIGHIQIMFGDKKIHVSRELARFARTPILTVYK